MARTLRLFELAVVLVWTSLCCSSCILLELSKTATLTVVKILSKTSAAYFLFFLAVPALIVLSLKLMKSMLNLYNQLNANQNLSYRNFLTNQFFDVLCSSFGYTCINIFISGILLKAMYYFFSHSFFFRLFFGYFLFILIVLFWLVVTNKLNFNAKDFILSINYLFIVFFAVFLYVEDLIFLSLVYIFLSFEWVLIFFLSIFV